MTLTCNCNYFLFKSNLPNTACAWIRRRFTSINNCRSILGHASKRFSTQLSNRTHPSSNHKQKFITTDVPNRTCDGFRSSLFSSPTLHNNMPLQRGGGAKHGRKSRGDESPRICSRGTLIQVIPQIFVMFQNFKHSPWIRPPKFQPRSTPPGKGLLT
jgi:hypothetical protein